MINGKAVAEITAFSIESGYNLQSKTIRRTSMEKVKAFFNKIDQAFEDFSLAAEFKKARTWLTGNDPYIEGIMGLLFLVVLFLGLILTTIMYMYPEK